MWVNEWALMNVNKVSVTLLHYLQSLLSGGVAWFAVVCITGKHCNVLFSFPIHALQFPLQCHLPCNTRCNAPRLSCIIVHPPCNIFVHLAILSNLQYMLQHLAMLSDLQYMLQHSPSALHHRPLTLPTVLYKDCAHPHIIQHIAPTQSFLPSTRFAEVVITVWPCSSLGCCCCLYPVAALDHVGGSGGGGSWWSW